GFRVTGVQTCALPISADAGDDVGRNRAGFDERGEQLRLGVAPPGPARRHGGLSFLPPPRAPVPRAGTLPPPGADQAQGGGGGGGGGHLALSGADDGARGDRGNGQHRGRRGRDRHRGAGGPLLDVDDRAGGDGD